MKKEKFVLYALIAAVPFLLAMGFMGDPPALEKAPEPKTRLDAVVLDSEGTSTTVSYISYDGELYLPVYRGKGLITIPFQNISRIEFGPKKSHTREVTIHFTDQREETFRMDIKVLFVGKLPFGTYQIQAKDLSSITFLEPASDSQDPDATKKGNSQT